MDQRRVNGNPAMNLLRLAALAAAIVFAPSACSDDSASKKGEKQAKSPFATYSIKILHGNTQRRFEFPPLPERGFALPLKHLQGDRQQFAPNTLFKTANANAPSPAPKGGSAEPQATIETPDGGVDTGDDLSNPLGWALVYGAAYECGMGSRAGLTDYPQGQQPVLPPWSGRSYFIFDTAPAFCDAQVAYEEHMLCIADRLAEIADTPAPQSWSKVPAVPTVPGMPGGPWTIPPQATKDRFIARDLAMHVLALVGFTELTQYPAPPGSTQQVRTCARAYGEAAALTGTPPQEVLDNYYATVFGVGANVPSPYFPPAEMRVTLGNFVELAKARMLFNAHVVRSAARLLRVQIDSGVVADLAGAEQQRALATDPDRGARLMWGAETEASEPYNSLAHATRVLAGRLETGLLGSPETCSTVLPMDILSAGLGAEFSGRYADRGVTTRDQEVASKLIDRAGIVVPEESATTAPIGTLRAAIRDQLVANAAAIHGLPANDPGFISWGEGRAIIEMVKMLADENIRFALTRSAAVFRQLAGARPDGLNPSNPGGGLTAMGTVASLEAAGGIAVDSGIPRTDLAVDFMSRAGGIQTASQCNEADPEGGSILADSGTAAAFQDAFNAGETLRKRLIALREEAKLVFDEEEDVVTVPNGGAVEIRTWAGPGRIGLKAFGTPMADIGIMLVGFNPEDLAVSTPEAMPDEIVLVYGPPWVVTTGERGPASRRDHR
jgi:hypothetical protein